MASNLEILQRAELEIIKEFHRICEEYNLRYILIYGTMLGCARHQGFIPWDDDVDVVMPLEDYCKFNEIANRVADDRYMVLNEKSVPNYYRYHAFAKFVKKRSSAIFEYPFVRNYIQPIYIDIFPAFYVPKSCGKYKLIQTSNFILGQTVKMKYSGLFKHTKRGVIAKTGMFMFYCLNRITPQKNGYSLAIKIASSVTRKDARSYYVGNLYSVNAIKYCQMPLDVFEDRILMKFEDTELYMPKKFDRILRLTYGDYMQLPPENKRKSHGFKFVSDEIGYDEYDQQQKASQQ